MKPGPLLLALVTVLPAAAAFGGDREEIFYPEYAIIDRFPREVRVGETLILGIEVRRGFSSPVIAVTMPSGRTKYFRAERTAGNKDLFHLPFEAGKGGYRVELVVDSARGDMTAAQFTIWAGMPKPAVTETGRTRTTMSDYPREDRRENPIRLEREFFRMLNRYRVEQGLKPFPWLEPAAILGREHWKGFLNLDPLPPKLSHLLPLDGSIADRFEDFYAWPDTVRKFPLAKPEIGPEATSFCSESLAMTFSLEWLLHEYFLRESAFRAPLISSYPSHAAVAIVRDEGRYDLKKYGPPGTTEKDRKKYRGESAPRSYMCVAVVYVQVNSTRVQREIEMHRRDLTTKERSERDPKKQADLLRALGRIGDPRSFGTFEKRLRDRDVEVRAAALDALFLNAPELAEKWLSAEARDYHRAFRADFYASVIPDLRTLTLVEYDFRAQRRGAWLIEELTMLAEARRKNAVAQIAAGEEQEGREALIAVAAAFEGLPPAEAAKKQAEEIETGSR
jgi:hypothetical protein